MENTTIAIILLLFVVLLILYSPSEHMGFDDVLKEHVLKNTGKIPYYGPTTHEIDTHARVTQHANKITPAIPVRSLHNKRSNKPGVSEHMDDSMGERGEDALEVALNGGSGWSVFYE
jgi:hypothetical protein